MSTSALLFLAIFSACCCVFALWLIRWKEQQRVKRARRMIELSDQCHLFADILGHLHSWLSQNTLNYIAREILRLSQELQKLGGPLSSSLRQHQNQAQLQLSSPQAPKRQPLPGEEAQAKPLRLAVEQLIRSIKGSYQDKQLNTQVANQLLKEARQLNVRICTHVFYSKGEHAVRANNRPQARHHFSNVIRTIDELNSAPTSLIKLKQKAQQRLSQLEQQAQETVKAGTRLERAAEIMNDGQDEWKKKHF